MAGPDYNILFQAPNPGEAFAQSFQQGMQKREDQQQRNALAALAMNPNDPQAQAAAAQFAPQAVIQMRSQAQQQALQLAEQHRENIVRGAQIIRQVQPKDQASWDQARALAAQAGIDISEVPPQFDPQYVHGITALADAFAPEKQQGTTSQQDYEYAVRNGFKGSFTDYLQFVHPPSALSIPGGGSITYPGQGGGSGALPHVSTPQEASKLPPGTQFVLPDGRIGTVPGGAGGNASGGFPSGGQ